MSRVRILSTKKLDASFLDEALFELKQLDFISVEPIKSKEINERIKQLSEQNVEVIFTSSNSVNAVLPYLDATPGWKIFCLAGKTQEAVTGKFGKQHIIGIGDNASELAARIIEYGSKKVIFFCGDIRREELPNTLQTAAIGIEELIVYQTTETPHQVDEAFDAVIFFSPSAVKSFFSSNQLSKNTVCFSIGDTTAAEIKQFTENKLVVAEKPTQVSVASAINQFYNQNVQP